MSLYCIYLSSFAGVFRLLTFSRNRINGLQIIYSRCVHVLSCLFSKDSYPYNLPVVMCLDHEFYHTFLWLLRPRQTHGLFQS